MDLSIVWENDQTKEGDPMAWIGLELLIIGWGLGLLAGFFAGWAWGVWRLGQLTRIERMRDELAWMRG
mgnify:CR=1 FL=1